MKKYRSVKLASDSRALNESFAKDMYVIPNLKNLMSLIAEKNYGKESEVLYSSVDMKYAYGQVSLHESTTKHCNFKILGG